MCTYSSKIDYSKIFCFKQKTAYEMRISDWSSDVCSSDLAVSWQSSTPAATVSASRPNRPNECPGSIDHHTDSKDHRRSSPRPTIGRESCRERVCQHV